MENKIALVDIGANLSHESFSDDLDIVLAEAKQAGIEKIMLTGTCIESSLQAVDLCKQHPGFLFSTAGIHPHDAKDYDNDTKKALEQLALNQSVKAIGETGLDFNRDFSPRPLQEKAFEAQLALAVELGMPIFLHQRDAHERFLPILKEYRDDLCRGVVHCFTGSKSELFDYLDLDMFIGITGWVCDERRGQHLHPLLKEIPLQRLLIETDSPYLLPRSIRPKPKSRRNTPANLTYVLKTVANCLDLPDAIVAQQTKQNAVDFFDL